MYVIMLLLGVNIYSPAGFVNVSSGIGTDLSLISYILLPVRTLNVVLSPPINILSLIRLKNDRGHTKVSLTLVQCSS